MPLGLRRKPRAGQKLAPVDGWLKLGEISDALPQLHKLKANARRANGNRKPHDVREQFQMPLDGENVTNSGTAIATLSNFIQSHPLIVIFSTVSAIVASTVAGVLGLVSFVDQSVNVAVVRDIAVMRASLLSVINERAKMTRLYAINTQGERSGHLSDLIRAAKDGRTIFVRYTRKGNLEDGRVYRTEWFRSCDGYSIDYFDNNDILTCFILRLPDTSILETGRQIVDPTTFEDYSVSTEGAVLWRKYTISERQIFEDPRAFAAQGTDIQWWAAPEPLLVSTDQ